MNKIDKMYIDNLTDILENGSDDFDGSVRPVYKDGSPSHTKFITQVFEKYDISKGEFPITSLRPTAWKSGIKELLAIYQSQLNTQEGFEKHGVNWWSPWIDECGTIGKAYPYNLESHRPNEMEKSIVKIKPRIVDNIKGNLKQITDFEIEPITSDDKDEWVGKTLHLNDGDYLIYRKHYIVKSNRNRKYYKIQSLDNGYILDIRSDRIGKIFDLSNENPLSRSTYGIGFRGKYKSVSNFSDEELEILKDRWENMFRRCYSDYYEHKECYKETFVHQDWHSLEQFIRDIRSIPQYHLAKEDGFKGWELDKDYFGSNCYSSDTCVFLRQDENILYCSSNPFIATHPDGREELCISQTKFAYENNMKQPNVHDAIYEKKNHNYKGFSFKLVEDNEFVYRYELSRNQVNELLNGLQNNPFSRRHIISFWNWANIDKKNLVECAYETLWSVRKRKDGKYYLDMTLIQRSNDYAVAGHINKIQYCALMMMVAKHCNLEVGVFAHYIQNLHIYDRHFDQAEELIRRFKENPDLPQPKLILDTDKTNFYDFTIDDFKIEDYAPIKPQLKFELGE